MIYCKVSNNKEHGWFNGDGFHGDWDGDEVHGIGLQPVGMGMHGLMSLFSRNERRIQIKLNGCVKEPNISIYLFFLPVT